MLAAGGIIFILSFLVPARGEKNKAQTAPVTREEIRSMVSLEMDAVKDRVDEMAEEAFVSAMEKSERSMERLSNEKIMAINEYSDTVLSEIHKNHEEAVFLYDMLNTKHTSLKNTVSEVNRTVKEAGEKINSFQSSQKVSPGFTSGQKPAAAGQAVAESMFVEEQPPVMEPKHTVEAGSVAERKPAMELKFAAEPEFSGNSNVQILELYNRGMDKVAIAKELGLGVGEVKLVIDLFEGT